MSSTADIKNGVVLNIDGQLWSVVEFQHVKPGKGGAFVRTKLKNVMSGKVVVDGIVITKPGTLLARQAKVSLRGIQSRFASRGGFKLEKALSRFGIDVGGLTCMDAGASTGGFTDCLLQHGAAKVYAVEVGYGQLLGRLALDPMLALAFAREGLR